MVFDHQTKWYLRNGKLNPWETSPSILYYPSAPNLSKTLLEISEEGQKSLITQIHEAITLIINTWEKRETHAPPTGRWVGEALASLFKATDFWTFSEIS
jgi:hypothetical protein